MVYEYERIAMLGEKMPAGLPMPDQLMFLGLRLLYESSKRGIIDRETGREEKWKMSYQKYLWEQKMKGKEKLAEQCAEFLKNVESAANHYAKDRTLENADKLWQAVSDLL